MRQNEKEVFDRVIAIVKPFVKARNAFDNITPGTLIQKDLRVNSARVVDIVLEIESVFNIQIKDDEADSIRTIGDAVKLVLRLRPAL